MKFRLSEPNGTTLNNALKIGLMSAILSLSACTTLPKTSNPVGVHKSVGDFLMGLPDAKEARKYAPIFTEQALSIAIDQEAALKEGKVK